jgi:hypothetical protein
MRIVAKNENINDNRIDIFHSEAPKNIRIRDGSFFRISGYFCVL